MIPDLRRYASFHLFPSFRKIFVTKLSNDGFRYSQKNDSICCDYCKCVFNDWNAGPNGAHTSHKTGCKMLETLVTNVHRFGVPPLQTDGRGIPSNRRGIHSSRKNEKDSLNPERENKRNSTNTNGEGEALIVSPKKITYVFTEEADHKHAVGTPFYSKLPQLEKTLSWMFSTFWLSRHIAKASVLTLTLYPASLDVPMYPAMASLSRRYSSFDGVHIDDIFGVEPSAANLPNSIAREGYFYDTVTQECKCFYCGIPFYSNPAVRRASHPPPGQHCDQRNSSIDQLFPPAPPPTLNTLGVNPRNPGVFRSIQTTWTAQTMQQSLAALGITPRQQHPGYFCVNLRRDSFRNHPPSTLDYGDLAMAGFYAVTLTDIRCFHCGLAMQMREFHTQNGGQRPDLYNMLLLHTHRQPACSFATVELQAEEARRRTPASQRQPQARGPAAPDDNAGQATASGYARGQCVRCGNIATVLLLPCEHLVLCRRCEQGERICPLCRQRIRNTVNVHRT